MSQSSVYITRIEILLRSQGINPDSDASYNQIFAETDDRKFVRRLRMYLEFLNQSVDAANSKNKHD